MSSPLQLMNSPLQLNEINIYPIKSTRRVELGEGIVERQGLRGDRRWMLIEADGQFISQRSDPRLALVQARLDVGRLSVAAPDMPPLRISLPACGSPEMNVRIWDDVVEARQATDEAGEWFTKYLGRPVKLVFMEKPDTRKVDPQYAVRADDRVSFADGYPILLTSQDSLGDLNRRMDSPIPMDRFRPNLVVTGAPPWKEDDWRRIRIGDVAFDVVKSCSRCVVTTTDQATARQGKEPLRTLNKFRVLDGKVRFGQNLIPVEEGVVRVGDPVRVIA